MELQILPSISLDSIMADPETPDEVVIAAVDVLSEMSRQIYEAKTVLQGRILAKMKMDNATKMSFVGRDGSQKIATLKSGTMECKRDDADEFYKQQGFDPSEIGTYKYVPSWSKAKEARKVGGIKQLAIDELFKPGNTSLKIEPLTKKLS